MQASGLAAETFAGWTVGGVTYDAMSGRNPLLDQPLPSVPQGLTIALRCAAIPDPQAVPAPGPGAPPATPVAAADSQKLLAVMEMNWQAIIQIERQMEAVRKQLGGLLGRLGSLNRDLNPDERKHADSVDLKDWQDARRWLRDCASTVSRFIRDYDIGMTSTAGHRARLEDLYRQYVSQGQPFAGIGAAAQEFESHRRSVQSLLSQMQNASNAASRDGEQRAQQLLQRIAAKVRRGRRNTS